MPLFQIIDCLKNLAIRHNENREQMYCVVQEVFDIINSEPSTALLQVIFEFIYVLSFDLRIRKTMMNDHRLPTILYNNMSKEGMQHIAKWCLKLVNA